MQNMDSLPVTPVPLFRRFAKILALSLVISSQLPAQTAAEMATAKGFHLHSLFQSNMVIQRDKPVTIWGWADPGAQVTVSFGESSMMATAAADRTWKVDLPAFPANAVPATMRITCGADTLKLDNLLVGDVWVLGGQSNMQHPMSHVEGGPVEIASAHFPEIRLLTVPPMIDDQVKVNFPRREKGTQPDGDWDVCAPDTVRDFSAIGYIFGRRIHMASQVPIGLIDVSRWGTTVESWTPHPVLQAMDSEVVNAQLADWAGKTAKFDPEKDLEARRKNYFRHHPDGTEAPTELDPGPQANQNYPGKCYDTFIAPLAGLGVKGTIFHQGFNNARPDAAAFYHQVFPRMIASWREAFQDSEMPFGIISLCTDGDPQTLENFSERMMDYGIYVREAQYKTFLDLHQAGDRHVGYASSYDQRHAWYHPQNKIPAAERIACWALATQYGIAGVYWKPPILTRMERVDGTLRLHFDEEVGPKEKGSALVGFAISGEDQKYQPAEAQPLVTGKDPRGKPSYDPKVVVLSSPHVADPVHFRYAWGRNPLGNACIPSVPKRHIALGTQRSDDWAYWEVPHLDLPAHERTTRQGLDKIREALRLIDLERRVLDAKRVLERDGERYKEPAKRLSPGAAQGQR